MGTKAPAGRSLLMWLAGMDLRIPLIAVPPVLPLIHRDLGLNEKDVALLTGMPVLLFALAAIPGSLAVARIGARRALIAGFWLVALASATRGAGTSVAALFALTFLTGLGIALVQPAMPSLVSAWFPDAIARATAVYSNGLLAGEAIAAALTIPFVLPLVHGSWQASFALWALPVALVALLVRFATPHVALPAAQRRRWMPDWRDPMTWRLGLMQGGGSAIYFGVNAFLPDYLHAAGRAGLVAPALAALNVAQVPASLLVLAFPRAFAGKRRALIVPAVSCLPAVALLLLLPQAGAVVTGCALVGFFSAFLIVLALALPPALAPHDDVHRLAAGMFAIGYVVAFVVPLAGGALWDATRIASSAFAPVALACVLAVAAAATLQLPGKERPLA